MVRCPRCQGAILGVAYTTPDGERLHFGCRELPKVPPQQWLLPWLRSLALEHHLNEAVKFAKMERARSVEDLRRNWFALSNFLRLKSVEHHRLAEACGAVPTSSSARTRSSVDESYDIETCLEPWLESLSLLPHLEAAFAWCESAGASCLEDIVERWKDFALGLDLNQEECARLEQASQRGQRDEYPTSQQEPDGLPVGVSRGLGFYEAKMLASLACRPDDACSPDQCEPRSLDGEDEVSRSTLEQEKGDDHVATRREDSRVGDSFEERPAAPSATASEGPSPDEVPAPEEDWLLTWLSRWNLEEFLEGSKEWCESMGAADLPEVQENWEDLADHLGLEGDSRRRLEEAANASEESPEEQEHSQIHDKNESDGENGEEKEEGEQTHSQDGQKTILRENSLAHARSEDRATESDRTSSHDAVRERTASKVEDEGASTRKSSADAGEGLVCGSKSTSTSGCCVEPCLQDLCNTFSPSSSSRAVLFGPPNDPYTLLEKLGSGATSVVHRCTRRGESFAVKIMNLQRLRMQPQCSQILRSMNRETHLLLNLRHEKIVQLRDFFEVGEQLYLVLDLVSGGDLYDHILANGRMQEDEARFVFVQLVDALMYIHDKNIVHRDLKLDNILIDSEASEPGRMRVKISDFGHSKAIRDGYTQAKTACGTPQYWAPEQQSARYSGGYDEKVDLWSLGVVLYAMLMGTLPFSSTADSRSATFKFSGSRQAEEVLRGLIRVDPKQRMELHEAKASAWVTEGRQHGVPGALPAKGTSFTCDFPTEEFRMRLPRLPTDIESFREALHCYSRKHHIAASLQVLEVVVDLPCVTETDCERNEAAKQDLKALLKRHFGAQLPAVPGLHKLRTMRSFDAEVATILTEEEGNLKAIYQQDFSILGTAYWSIQLRDGVSLNVDVACGYPRESPPCLELDGIDQAKALRITQQLLASWVPGEPCIFEWANRIEEELGRSDDEDEQAKADDPGLPNTPTDERSGENQQGSNIYKPGGKYHRQGPRSVQKGQRSRVFDPESMDPANKVDLVHGPEVIERRSKFQAHFAKVRNTGQVKWAHRELLSLDKCKTATHNMVAWCFYDYYRSMRVIDFDNDGEPDGGRCLSKVLHHGRYSGIFIMVSRWYGGVELGTDRLKVINRVAQQLLELHSIEPEAKEGPKPKKKTKEKKTKAEGQG